MKMAFIGAGRVGIALGLYFKKHRINITGYYSKTYDSALKASEMIGTKAYKYLDELIDDSRFIFITTNDDSISKVAKDLCDLRDSWVGYIVAHASGALTSDILKELEIKGAKTFSIHPLQTFVEPETTYTQLSSTMFTIEGTKDIKLIEDIFIKTNNKYTIIDKKNKPLYHAGACIISNYLVTLLGNGFDFIRQSGFKEEDIYDAVEPLIMGTLNNIKHLGINNALSGPLARGDIETIKNHIENIYNKNQLDFYKYMGLHTLELTTNNLDYKEIKGVLQGGEITNE